MTEKDINAVSDAIALALDRYNQYQAPGGTHHGQAVEYVRNDVRTFLRGAADAPLTASADVAPPTACKVNPLTVDVGYVSPDEANDLLKKVKKQITK